MQPDFWHERWRQGQIGFHLPEYHPALLKHWPALSLPRASRVLVPLCGRSLDLAWLARRGHAVTGIELSAIAASEFYRHESITPEIAPAGRFARYAGGGIEILQGDFFDLEPALVAGVAACYDRAALVALPPDMRRDYARLLAGLLPPATPLLLITLEYEQSRMDGPPFAVLEPEVCELFDRDFAIERLERQDALPGSPRFAERGLDWLVETVYALRRR